MQKKKNLKVKTLPSEHAMITDNYGNACARKGTPYINNCDFSLAGDLLSYIHGDMKERVPAQRNNIITFSQREFLSTVTMAANGYAYVPTACKDKSATCKLHVVFHGCQQNAATVNDVYVVHSGYNEWAESNNIIVIYPQTATTFVPLNPQGCWDWWGFTDSNYGNKRGYQMDAVYKMIKRVAGL